MQGHLKKNLANIAFLLAAPAALLAGGPAASASPDIAGAASPLVIGESFTIESAILAETRRINVFASRGYAVAADAPLPVLYMPDGGVREDFLHIAGLLQVSVDNGTMRPFMLVGIENTQRRRDMTGPTQNAEDRKIAPVVGGSAAFRRFMKEELMPAVKGRYRTTGETAIVGESLAGLFVVETLLLEPEMFNTYLAFDPSLWWNSSELLGRMEALLAKRPGTAQTLYLASSGEAGLAQGARQLAAALAARAPAGLRWHYEKMPQESHASIYHPAALQAFRTVFKPGK